MNNRDRWPKTICPGDLLLGRALWTVVLMERMTWGKAAGLVYQYVCPSSFDRCSPISTPCIIHPLSYAALDHSIPLLN